MCTVQIIIAWAEKTKLVPTGRTITRDRNQLPEFRADWEGRACMWLRKGTEADVEKAKTWAATEGRSVFTFPSSEKKPLDRARDFAVTEQKAAGQS